MAAAPCFLRRSRVALGAVAAALLLVAAAAQAGSTPPPPISPAQARALTNACTSVLSPSLPSVVAHGGFSVTFNSALAGTLAGSVDYNDSGSGGGRVLVYHGAAGTMLVYDPAGGGSVIAYRHGSSVNLFAGPGGGHYAGAGGATARADAASYGSGCAEAGPEPSGGVANWPSGRQLTRIRLCIRASNAVAAQCHSFRRVGIGPFATVKHTFTRPQKVKLTLPLTTDGRLVFLAGQKARQLYRRRHPHARLLPTLSRAGQFSFTPAR